jgi:hypothetical protein
LWSVIAATTLLAKHFPDAFSIDPSIESTEDNPYPIDEFYCTPLLWVRPTSEHRALVVRIMFLPIGFGLLTPRSSILPTVPLRPLLIPTSKSRTSYPYRWSILYPIPRRRRRRTGRWGMWRMLRGMSRVLSRAPYTVAHLLVLHTRPNQLLHLRQSLRAPLSLPVLPRPSLGALSMSRRRVPPVARPLRCLWHRTVPHPGRPTAVLLHPPLCHLPPR